MQQINEPLVKNFYKGYKKEFAYKTAKELINKHNSVAKLDTTINEVIKLIIKDEFDYIPVIDNNEKVLGVITPSSIINLLKDN